MNLVASVLKDQMESFRTAIASCERLSSDKKNDVKFWKRELSKYRNKMMLAIEIGRKAFVE